MGSYSRDGGDHMVCVECDSTFDQREQGNVVGGTLALHEVVRLKASKLSYDGFLDA